MAETRFSRQLKAKLAEEVAKRAEEISYGITTDSYVKNVGWCQGMRDAIKFCEELDSKDPD